MAGTKISDATTTTPVGSDMIPFARDSDATARHMTVAALLASGWLDANETWTYAAADDPTYIFAVSGDKTNKYSAGMRIRLTQTTVKYFIITRVDYVEPNTGIYIYGGTDYDLADATITDPYYSTHKAPYGFPIEPEKWTEEAVHSANTFQTPPTQNIWYNLGTFKLDVPIGSWNLGYQALIGISKASTASVQVFGTLSKVNNAVDDHEFTVSEILTGATGTLQAYVHGNRSKFVTHTAETTYYFLVRTILTSVAWIGLQAADNYGHAVIRATCAYL